MRISGERVICANCGMVYEKPPTQKVWNIGVPFTVEGTEFCPGCGSNAADPIYQSGEWDWWSPVTTSGSAQWAVDNV